ncbi:hypothetical protein XELAEV_18034397mg [Xenopus laevis]|uniref:Olfactory receptor n=1 Tax=Xenopus laevis TaxID=8355 RepID=A0A974HB19_XENLA|nr:hypothetical protein XELAEV_18034397mg [Xenopus laevis]
MDSNKSYFIIQGFSNYDGLQIPIFVVLLGVYLMILISNLTVLLVISMDSHLHTPMYIFLMNLSFIDISFTSNIVPYLLYSLFTQHRDITFMGCMIQMYFCLSLFCTEFILLAIMAYDRYVAICQPLVYVFRMSQTHCIYLLSVAYTIGFLDPTSYFFLISKFSFCSSISIDHFYCDFETLLKLSCSDTLYVEILNYFEGALVTLNTFILTVISYIFIISAILNIKSKEGQYKAFSTCTSHLTCVIIFYFTIISLYIRPISTYSPKQGKYFALFYIILIPLLNPYIYTLKNKEFHLSLRKLKRRFFI